MVSRGYGRRTDDCREVLDDSDPRDVGDEPALIHRATGAPVFVARPPHRGRARPARRGIPDTQVIVSDDGLQHLALARDIEICVFDDRGIGNGWLLPAGPLRERVAAPLRPGAAQRRAARLRRATRRHARLAAMRRPAGRTARAARHASPASR